MYDTLCFLEKNQYRNNSDAMKAVETYEMETSSKFSVYMKDKEFGAPGTIHIYLYCHFFLKLFYR